MNEYELLYVISPRLSAEEVDATIALVQGLIESGGGEVTMTDNWGRRRIAYPIKHHLEATYVLAYLKLGGDRVAEFERAMTISEDILRHLLTRGIIPGYEGPPEQELVEAGRRPAPRYAERRGPLAEAAPDEGAPAEASSAEPVPAEAAATEGAADAPAAEEQPRAGEGAATEGAAAAPAAEEQPRAEEAATTEEAAAAPAAEEQPRAEEPAATEGAADAPAAEEQPRTEEPAETPSPATASAE